MLAKGGRWSCWVFLYWLAWNHLSTWNIYIYIYALSDCRCSSEELQLCIQILIIYVVLHLKLYLKWLCIAVVSLVVKQIATRYTFPSKMLQAQCQNPYNSKYHNSEYDWRFSELHWTFCQMLRFKLTRGSNQAKTLTPTQSKYMQHIMLLTSVMFLFWSMSLSDYIAGSGNHGTSAASHCHCTAATVTACEAGAVAWCYRRTITCRLGGRGHSFGFCISPGWGWYSCKAPGLTGSSFNLSMFFSPSWPKQPSYLYFLGYA